MLYNLYKYYIFRQNLLNIQTQKDNF